MARTGIARNFVKISVSTTIEVGDNSLKALADLNEKLEGSVVQMAKDLGIAATAITVDAKPIRAKAA